MRGDKYNEDKYNEYVEELNDIYRKAEERQKKTREIIADGSKTEFWEELRKILVDLQDQACEAFPSAPVQRIPELQQMYKIPQEIINTVEHLAQEQSVIDAKMKKEALNDSGE